MGFRYLIRRVLMMIPVLFGFVTFLFFMIRFAPGGPFDEERQVSPRIGTSLFGVANYGGLAPVGQRALGCTR